MMMVPMVTGTEIVFWICGVLAILGAIGLVTLSKPVYSALCLALVMVCLAVIYASLGAPFLMAVQIIVYTGAILMLFLFVIMLVGVDTHDSFTETLKGHRALVILAGVGILALLVIAVVQAGLGPAIGLDAANAGGNVEGLASLIFSKYVIAFEATAALLITAAVAAMVLAYPEKVKAKIGQFERAAERFTGFTEDGHHLGPRPSSGVFARHNSIATPALLPDGSVAESSVSQILADRVAISSSEELWGPHDEVIAAIESYEDVFEIEGINDLLDVVILGLDDEDEGDEDIAQKEILEADVPSESEEN